MKKKAPNSFILFCRKRTHELKIKGQETSKRELMNEWERIPKEQKEEFQNQSRCIQFTLDIDNRINNKKVTTHISHTSMIIPSEESIEYTTFSELDYPEKVKRPPNAYLLFNRDMRRKQKEFNKGLTSGDISKAISEKWKQLSKAEKEEYIEQESLLKQKENVVYSRRSKSELTQATKKTAKSMKKRFYKKKSERLEGIPDPRGRKKKGADTNLPKHPMSAYLHFAKMMRPIVKKDFPGATLVDISRQIGLKWRSMASSELIPWIELANQDKARYARELKYGISLIDNK